MSPRQGSLAFEGDAAGPAEDRTTQAYAGARRPRGRQNGVELIGIVGRNWVVLNRDPLVDGSSGRRVGGSFESGLRTMCRLLALD